MIYELRHLTTYGYSRSVPFSRCILRLLPREGGGQRVRRSELTITPRPAERSDGLCFFGNHMTTITIARPHRELKLEMRARIEVAREPPPHAGLTRNWEEVARLALASRSLAPDSPAHHLYPSRLVPHVPAVIGYARESFGAARPVLEAACELMARIRRDFVYDPEATEVSTPLADAFARRHGVCQDFAHIMIAGLRGLGLPAAYVSGYIRTIPPPGQERLEGADASHAWAMLWCGPETGWIGLDPTNDLIVADDHIVTAFGRDYADVAPLDGVVVGPGTQKIGIAVDVIPVG
ncbi:transglutaminase family protein [Bosea sp. (in: a-proteobacteria)]|uniref:transglutaminase family protein n=1 Tax=Bosea sp. (in: a-proteobacteria) TaxID=1871050 RepID=UPI00261FD4AE|nr:transglutaminase family protein [Bosea sp. (in: a-proteobacteria)]MCO5089418.1 transglutaminase family protein [Bosea sp. (in: a-proteobacteria)]